MQKHHNSVLYRVNGNYTHTAVLLARVHRPVELTLKLLSLRHMDIIKDLLMHHVCLPEKIMHTNTKPENFIKGFSFHISVFSVIYCCIDLYACMRNAMTKCLTANAKSLIQFYVKPH